MGRLTRPNTNRLTHMLGEFSRKLMHRIGFSNPIYALKLKGPHPLRLLATPKDPWKGDPAAGARLLAGGFAKSGQKLTRGPVDSKISGKDTDTWTPAELWQTQGMAKGWKIWLHSFDYLRDLAAVSDTAAARNRAESLVKEWLKHYDKWDPLVWRPDILARRLMNWMTYAPLIISTNDHVYRSLVLNSTARQSRHLARSLGDARVGPPRLVAATGLVYSGLFLPSASMRLKRGTGKLERELQLQVLADGGIITRNPADLYHLLRDLVTLRGAFLQMNMNVPESLIGAIDRMGPMLKTLCHGDRRLSLFNGSTEMTTAGVEETLATIKNIGGDVGEAFGNAPHTGFQRLSRGNTLVIADTGPPSPLHFSRNNHAGTLSFEMSDGPDRLVVNCGSAASLPEGRPSAFSSIKPSSFNLAARATAAHSTLVLNDTNSSEVLHNGYIGTGPTEVTFNRHEEEGNRPEKEGGVWMEASHNGYAERFGLIHVRRLFLNTEGDDFRGEDMLRRTGRNHATSDRFDVRFHLHPRVLMNADEKEGGITLRLASGQKWLFRAKGGRISTDESLYMGTPGTPEKSRHIVITGEAGAGETVINWSFRRLDRPLDKGGEDGKG